MSATISTADLIKQIFKLGNPALGVYVAILVVFASAYEVFFLFVVSSTVSGNGFDMLFVNISIPPENLTIVLIISFIVRSLISLYSNYILYNYILYNYILVCLNLILLLILFDLKLIVHNYIYMC